MDPYIIEQQVGADLPLAAGVEHRTGMVLPPSTVEWRLRHMDPEVFAKDPESHLVRFAKALLGDAGAGQLRKRMLLYRLQSSLSSSHFYTLDKFYGSLFGVQRRRSETLSIDSAPNQTFDPTTEVASPDEWQQIFDADATYRARIIQFARALSHGPTPLGIELVCEAILKTDVDVFEDYVNSGEESGSATWGDLADLFPAYATIELFGFTYGQLGLGGGNAGGPSRWSFTIVPKAPITLEERRDLYRVLRRVVPATASFTVRQPTSLEPNYLPVVPKSLDDSSHYWQVSSYLSPNPELATLLGSNERTPVRRPPFSSYQGEAWSYVPDISRVTSYAIEQGHDDLTSPNYEIRTLPSGETRKYEPEFSLFSPYQVALGRYASDGIAVAHPYATSQLLTLTDNDETRAEYTGWLDTTSDIYIDGLSAEAAQQRIAAGRWWSRTNRRHYWSTPAREQDSATTEFVECEIDGVGERIANYITVEIPKFPHRTIVQVWSGNAGWENVLEHQVTESFPEKIIATTSNHHPQHDVDGHWLKVSRRFSSRTIKRVRIVQTRTLVGKGPVSPFGQPVAYSLGARHLDVGYRVSSRNDLPQSMRPGEIFAHSTDITGSRVDYELSEYRADSLLADPSGSWISAPQPTDKAVVRLYADLRDDRGDGQLFDRIWIDPLHSGNTLNVYYSNDSEEQSEGPRWESSDRPLAGAALYTLGNIAASNDGIALSTGSPSGLVIDNSFVQWETAKDWWLGIQLLMPNYTFGGSFDEGEPTAIDVTEPRLIWSATNAGEGSLNDFYLPLGADTEVLRIGDKYCMTLTHQPGELTFTYVTESVRKQMSIPFGFQPETPVAVTLGWDAASKQFTLAAKSIYGEPVEASSASFADFTDPSGPVLMPENPRVFSLGHPVMPAEGNPVLPEYPARATILGFVLKSGQKPSLAGEVGEFLVRPNTYVVKSRFADPEYDTTDNALIRFSPALYESASPWGIVGGPKARFDSLDWVPVRRDFITTRGYLYLSPTKAKYVCLEFTDLSPEPYENFGTHVHTVDLFPEGSRSPLASSADVHASVPGLVSAIGGESQSSLGAVDTYRPDAESLYVEDVALRNSLAENNTLWRFQSVYGSGPQRNRFSTVGPHDYVQQSVEHSDRIAYFAGLRELKFFRLSYQFRDDTAVYLDTLDDTSLLYENSFRHRDGMIDSKNAPGAQAISKTFQSTSPVQGIQFATHQSEPVQVVPNDDFSSPVLLENDWDGFTIEEITLDGEDPTALSLPNVFGDFITVTSLDAAVSYEIEADFLVSGYEGDFGLITTISRVGSGAIADGETVRVAYQRNTFGWQRMGTPNIVYQPEQERLLIERDTRPDQLWRDANGAVVQRTVNPVFSFRRPGLGGEIDDFGGVISPVVGVTRQGMMEAVARITLKTDLTSPLSLIIYGNDFEVYAESTLASGRAGETYEMSVPLIASEALSVLPNYGDSTLVDHPLYPLRPDYSDIDEEERPVSQWPLSDESGGQPVYGGVRVALIQFGATADGWYTERLSLFDESLLWEFSPDYIPGSESATWYPAIGPVRNNPNGILRFPEATDKWTFRVTAMRANLKVNAWQVRPWYTEKAPVQFLPQFRGANESLYDQFLPIEDDPMFDGWSRVAPKSWFTAQSYFGQAQILGAPSLSDDNRKWKRTALIASPTPSLVVADELNAQRNLSAASPNPQIVAEAEIIPGEPE